MCDLVDQLARPHTSRFRRDLITFVAGRPGHDRRYAVNVTKLEGELG